MFLSFTRLLFPFCFTLAALEAAVKAKARTGECTYADKVAGIQHEIDTIGSHSFDDANQIPLAPLATRTFLVTPNELGTGATLPPINVGFTADTVRAELVGLAAVLDAGVPTKSVSYIENQNGSVTVDFIQTDRAVFPYVHVREIHDFNDDCQVTSILGYVHGNLVCPTGPDALELLKNDVVAQLCGGLGADPA